MIRRTAFACALAAILAAFFVVPALAQTVRVCAPRAEALAHLSKKYSEGPVAVGLAANGGVLEVLSTATGSTWTIIVTMPNGVSCMLATGTAWEILSTEGERA